MQGFSKTAKILIAILAVMTVVSVGLLISKAMGDGEIAIPIIAAAGSLGGLAYTIKTAITERDEKMKQNEENAEGFDESDDIDEDY